MFDSLVVPRRPESTARPLPRNELRRLPGWPGMAWHQCRRVPATILFLAAIWAIGLSTGSIAHGPPRRLSGQVGAGLGALGHGYWWTPLSSGLWAAGLGSYLAVTVLGLLILAPAELRMGVTRTIGTLLVSQSAGFVLAAGLIKLAVLAHQPWLGSLAGETAVGALPGLAGVGLALSGTLTPLWRRRLRLLLAVTITISVMYVGRLEQVALACGAVGGLAALALPCDRGWPWAGLRVPRREGRVLVSMLVAVPALGALVVTLVATTNVPMPLPSLLFAAARPQPHGFGAVCPQADLAAICHGRLYASGMHAQAAPALLVLLCAYGLRRGCRLAWWIAVAINLALLALSIRVVATAGSHSSVPRAMLPAWAGMLLPIVTLAVLLVTRDLFELTAGRRASRKLAAVLAVALSVSFGTFLLLDYLLRRATPHPLPVRFLSYVLFSNRGFSVNLAGRVLFASAFLTFWTVVLGALTASFLRARIHRVANAADRARAVLRRGGSTLSYMSTWRGNEHWISPDGRAAISYRVIAGVAVTIGEPYGDPAALDAAIVEFARFCQQRSLQPCLYSVTAQTLAATDRLGWKSVEIAKDTLLPLPQLQFAGKKWQNVRNALNKAGREGITAEWWCYGEAPQDLVRQIRQISGKWAADKGLPEMSFMLGGLQELNDPNIRCLIAVGADRTVHAITSWMPVYENGQPIGWTLDFMRRNTDPGTSHGVMEFLIATAAMTFRDEGARFVSLSGAPLARLDLGEQPCAMRRLLDMTADVMEPVYGFQSLLQFKDKFHPVYEPLYLTYPDPAAIGSIAAAISRAYLPHLTSRQALRMLTKLHWPHLSRRPAATPQAATPQAATPQAAARVQG